MNFRHSRYLIVLPLALVAACGGVARFAGARPFAIAATPPPKPSRAQLRKNKIEITEKIQFEFDKAIIKDESSSLLHEIADVIRNNPQLKKISIEGFASSEGDPRHNTELSEARAAAVMDYLVKKENIDPGRLASKGWGSDQPIASNDTEEGREKNRRVEFLVVEQSNDATAENK
jgi:outer membrane protein OmpA-like peptidoglycan-associated protein